MPSCSLREAAIRSAATSIWPTNAPGQPGPRAQSRRTVPIPRPTVASTSIAPAIRLLLPARECAKQKSHGRGRVGDTRVRTGKRMNCSGSSDLGVEIQRFVVGEAKLAVHDLDARSIRSPAGREADGEDQLSAVLEHIVERIDAFGVRGPTSTSRARFLCFCAASRGAPWLGSTPRGGCRLADIGALVSREGGLDAARVTDGTSILGRLCAGSDWRAAAALTGSQPDSKQWVSDGR